MSGAAPVNPKLQFNGATGVLAGGRVFVYSAGTTTLVNTWQDKALTILNTNPITLDSAGRCLLWLDPSQNYKFVVYNSDLALEYTVDNVGGAADVPSVTAAAAASAAAAAASATAAAASATDAGTARDATYSLKGIYATTALAITATTSGQFAAVKQGFDNAIGIWKNSAGTAQWFEDKPFGLGETQYQIKAIEGATIAPPSVVPDLDYDSLDLTSDGRVIVNRSATTGPTKNQYPLTTGEIRKGSASDTPITKRAAVGPDGVTSSAAEFTFAGANVNVDVITLINAKTLQPGSYRVVVALKSKAGSGAENIQFWESVGGTTSIVGTLDASTGGSYGNGWDDKTFTFTVAAAASYTVRLRSQGAGNAFWMDRIRVFEDDGNAVPTWAAEANGHIKDFNSPRGVFARSGIQLDLTNTTTIGPLIPLSSFPSSTAVTEVACLLCASVDDVAQDNTAPIISGDPSVASGFTTTNLVFGTGNSSPESAHNNGAIVVSPPNSLEVSRINIRGEGIHTWGGILTTTRTRKFFRGLRFYDNQYQAAFASTNTPTLMFGGQSTTSRFRGKFLMAKIWINRGMTVAQFQAEQAKMEQKVQARGLTLGSFRDVLFCEGDSRLWNINTAPNGPGWNHQLADHGNFGTGLPSLKCFTYAWGGSILGTPSDTAPPPSTYINSSVYSRLPELLTYISDAHAKGLRILLVYQCDVNDSTAIKADYAAYVTREKAFLATIKAALDAGPNGSKLFVTTCTPIHTDAAFETPRANLNTARRLYPSQGVCEAILDFAADATLGTYSGTTAPTGYIDTVHYNQAGSAIAASIAKPVLAPYRLY